MDIIDVDGFSDGARYHPNHDGAHEKIARLKALEAMPGTLDASEERERAELAAWLETEAGYFVLEPISSEDYQKAKARSPHLRKSLKISGSKKGPEMDGTDFERRWDGWVLDLVRSRTRSVGNYRVKARDGTKRELTTFDELEQALKKTDAATNELLDDVHAALISISHLEAGLKN